MPLVAGSWLPARHQFEFVTPQSDPFCPPSCEPEPFYAGSNSRVVVAWERTSTRSARAA